MNIRCSTVPHHCKEVRNIAGIYRNTCVFNTKLGITLIAERATCVVTDFLHVRQQSYRPIKRVSFGRLKCCKPSNRPHCILQNGIPSCDTGMTRPNEVLSYPVKWPSSRFNDITDRENWSRSSSVVSSGASYSRPHDPRRKNQVGSDQVNERVYNLRRNCFRTGVHYLQLIRLLFSIIPECLYHHHGNTV